MAPPRKGATAIVDDSRSEASSGTREHKGTSSKGRKGANGSAAFKAAAAAANVTSAPAAQSVEQSEDLPKITWSEMPLEILHSYRHAYKLPTPSAFFKDYSRILLSQGIGLRSPTSIAARRAQLSQDASVSAGKKNFDPKPTPTTLTGVNGRHIPGRHDLYGQNVPGAKDRLNRIIGQGRVSKDQLALSVRKHFNSAGLVEQEAIARFLYKVREEGRGRQFRLRFQP